MKGNAYRQDLVSVYQEGVNYCVNNNHALFGYFPQTLRLIVYTLQNLDRNFANLVTPPTDGSAKCLVRYKVHLVP